MQAVSQSFWNMDYPYGLKLFIPFGHQSTNGMFNI